MSETPDGHAPWLERAHRAIPGGASTGSKRADALYGVSIASDLPTHQRRAYGCRIETADGRELVDCTMALGAVAFGYADRDVNHAVAHAISEGPVGGLSPVLEIEVAERLIDLIPCAEQVRFLKTGADATSAAVRLARAATGRSVVVACGYFGWHDWSNPGPGVPDRAHADVMVVPFDDVDALHSAVQRAGTELAAIVIEPLVHDIAADVWLRAARTLCDAHGAVLIFDEIKTAFRMHVGGVQALRGITPDLTSIGKAMANGFPIGAVVGRRAVMQAAQHAWISSTLASECVGLAATRAVLDRHAREDVCGALARIGAQMQQVVHEALASGGLELLVEGPPQMWRLVAREASLIDALVAECVREGVLLKRGAYQFASLSHDALALSVIRDAVTKGATRVAAMQHAQDRTEPGAPV